jgi:hypothetical protein
MGERGENRAKLVEITRSVSVAAFCRLLEIEVRAPA